MRCLVATDDGEICQVHFDRGGATYTQPLSIQSDPETFIRLVLNSTSRDVRILGLDTLPKFKKQGGVKVNGSITLKNEKGRFVQYEMDVNPMYVEKDRGLVARATMCFKLRRGDEEFVLKSTWRSPESRSKEYSKLEKAKGIKGVVQMISWDDSLTTNMLRGISEAKRSTSDQSINVPVAHRVLILMECTGPPIYAFTSEKQLIEAFSDIMGGKYDCTWFGKNALADGVAPRASRAVPQSESHARRYIDQQSCPGPSRCSSGRKGQAHRPRHGYRCRFAKDVLAGRIRAPLQHPTFIVSLIGP